MVSKATRVIEVLNEKIRIGRFYLILSGSPLAVLFGSIFGSGLPENKLTSILAITSLCLFAFTSYLIFVRLAKQHEAIVLIAEARRDKRADPDVSDEGAEKIYKESHPKSGFLLSLYPISLAVSYASLVFLVAAFLVFG